MVPLLSLPGFTWQSIEIKAAVIPGCAKRRPGIHNYGTSL
jgi:hypothetical protein